MYYLNKTELFSTVVIPLSNDEKIAIGYKSKNSVVIYQESKKGANLLFGKGHHNIVIARVIVLNNILSKPSFSEFRSEIFNINLDIINKSHFPNLFLFGYQLSFSQLLAIPASGKNIFIRYCLNNNFFLRGALQEIPYYKIHIYFSSNGISNGTFLNELDKKNDEVGRIFHKSQVAEFTRFKRYVSLYDRGKWDEFNSNNILNKELNYL